MTRLCLSIDFGTYILSNDEDDRTIPIQTDWDFPGVASPFGWTPCDECQDTDGKVDCAHKTAHTMITEAAAYLDDEPDGADNPGYFDVT